jgi:hypothetical protein
MLELSEIERVVVLVDDLERFRRRVGSDEVGLSLAEESLAAGGRSSVLTPL